MLFCDPKKVFLCTCEIKQFFYVNLQSLIYKAKNILLQRNHKDVCLGYYKVHKNMPSKARTDWEKTS